MLIEVAAVAAVADDMETAAPGTGGPLGGRDEEWGRSPMKAVTAMSAAVVGAGSTVTPRTGPKFGGAVLKDCKGETLMYEREM